MPIIERKDLPEIAPFFRTSFGKNVGDWLFKIAGIDKVNALYDKCKDAEGHLFCSSIIKTEKISYTVHGYEKLEAMDEPFITISNHAYGGMDGIVLIDMVGRLFPKFKVMVNQFLGMIKALRPSLIVVNPNAESEGKPTYTSIHGVKEFLAQLHDGLPVGLFPSGAVSDLRLGKPKVHHDSPFLDSDTLGPKDGSFLTRHIRDREWQMQAVKLIRKAKVPVVPVRFFDRNSAFYYYLGLISWKIRLLRLPHECLNKGGARIRIGIGDPIYPEQQSKITSEEDFRKMLRASVYDMSEPQGEGLTFNA